MVSLQLSKAVLAASDVQGRGTHAFALDQLDRIIFGVAYHLVVRHTTASNKL